MAESKHLTAEQRQLLFDFSGLVKELIQAPDVDVGELCAVFELARDFFGESMATNGQVSALAFLAFGPDLDLAERRRMVAVLKVEMPPSERV